MSVTKKRILIIVSILLAIFMMVILVRGNGSISSKIDYNPYEASEVDYTKLARIVDDKGKASFVEVEHEMLLDFVAEDLLFFAKKNYQEYRDQPDKVVGFRLDLVNRIDSENYIFKGKYGSVKNTIEVKIKTLKNDRLEVEILDTKSKITEIAELPSNSKKNKLIAILPIYGQNYMVDYSKKQNQDDLEINTTLYLRDPSIINVVKSDIKNKTGYDLKEDEMGILFPSGSSLFNE
jgi:hypothetical protein